MTYEEYLKKRLDRLNQNSHYGLMIDTEITKLVRDHIKEKEDNKMKATSVQSIKNVKDISVTIENYPVEMGSKITIIASTDDDIFEFEFEGSDLLQSCKAAGLFVGWEKDQKIRELEESLERWKKEAADCLRLRDEAQKEAYKLKKENEKYEEKIKKLEHDDMLDKNAADYWSKEHDILLERFAKLQVENEKLKDKLENVEPFRSLERTIKEKQELKEEYEDKIDDLQHKYDLERAANEAQRKFIKEYAGKGTEIEFNYAIGDDDEDTYVIVNKEEYKALKNIQNNVRLHGMDFTPDELVDRIRELEALKTPTIENFADEEPSDQPKNDNVNHPSHYETGKFECIEVMQEVFGTAAVMSFCKGNAFKYVYRMDRKNGTEDAKKAIWYLNKYLELYDKFTDEILDERKQRHGYRRYVNGGYKNGGKKSIPEGE